MTEPVGGPVGTKKVCESRKNDTNTMANDNLHSLVSANAQVGRQSSVRARIDVIRAKPLGAKKLK